jgi:mRNA interferase MazF
MKGYPFEVVANRAEGSVVLSDQLKSVGWRSRRATRKSTVKPEVLAEVCAKLRALIG